MRAPKARAKHLGYFTGERHMTSSFSNYRGGFRPLSPCWRPWWEGVGWRCNCSASPHQWHCSSPIRSPWAVMWKSDHVDDVRRRVPWQCRWRKAQSGHVGNGRRIGDMSIFTETVTYCWQILKQYVLIITWRTSYDHDYFINLQTFGRFQHCAFNDAYAIASSSLQNAVFRLINNAL